MGLLKGDLTNGTGCRRPPLLIITFRLGADQLSVEAPSIGASHEVPRRRPRERRRERLDA